MNSRRMLIRAAMIADGATTQAAPGAILLEDGRVLAAGRPEDIGPSENASIIDLPDAVVIPALVNAHCHLDLTHIGPVPWNGDFTLWVDAVRTRRAVDDQAITASMEQGVRLALAGGTAIIGDIAGGRSLAPIRALRASSLAGVSFLEVFGLGPRQPDAIAFLRQALASCESWQSGVALGLQPHAPYSCGLEVYREAAKLGQPLATHLAETLDEVAFVQSATGPLAEMLRQIGVSRGSGGGGGGGGWDDPIIGRGQHPIEYLEPVLREAPIVAAHLNYVEDKHLALLASVPITVAYCPRASAYFGHPHAGKPPHRYREMLNLGLNVALGTDSILCLDRADRLSVLDEMRFLYRRDAVDPLVLLRMGTVNGAIGLGFDPSWVMLSPGPTAGLLAVPIDIGRRQFKDPLHHIMQSDAPPRWLVGPIKPGKLMRSMP